MGAALDFERLGVFKVAVDVVAVLDDVAAQLPDGRGYLRDQFRRAANPTVPRSARAFAGLRLRSH